MTDYITREAALNFETKITAAPSEIQAISQGMALYAEHIKAIPAADVAPVVHARWINVVHAIAVTTANCSECRCEAIWRARNKPYIVCPNCGAIMDGGETDA